MWRLIKAIVLLIIVGFIALTGYAYFGDYKPEIRTINQPVDLNVN